MTTEQREELAEELRRAIDEAKQSMLDCEPGDARIDSARHHLTILQRTRAHEGMERSGQEPEMTRVMYARNSRQAPRPSKCAR